MRRHAIVITAMGMRCSLGDDVIGSCAALRAGLVRARELDYASVINENGAPEHPVGHPVESVLGFRGTAKLLALAKPAFEEVLARGRLRDHAPARLGFYLALPPPTSKTGGSTNTRASAQESVLCGSLTKLGRFPIRAEFQREFRCGHAGVMWATEQACRDLGSRLLDQCIVGGVDSLLDDATLQALHDHRRLKSEDAPDGLQPGEAAAFFLLERMDSAVQRGADLLAAVTQVSTAQDTPEDGRRIPGVALGNAVSALLGPSSQAPGMGWFISDINGEPGRAMEWGNLIVRLASSHPWLREAPLWYPASSLGDTGAASGAISVCAAVRAFARGYAPADAAFVLSSSDGAERGALQVERFTSR